MKPVKVILICLLISCAEYQASRDGFTSLLRVERYDSGFDLCSSQAGIEVLAGLDKNRNWILEFEEAQSVTPVCDSENSQPNGFSVIEMINPCGDAPGLDEVLLRLSNGTLIAHLSSGQQQFLAVIGNGNFVTTDGTNCHFSVNNGQVSW